MSSYIDEYGYRVIEDPENTLVVEKAGYCTKCHHTYFSKELVEKVSRWDFKTKKFRPFGFKHIDCLIALADRRPRKLNPNFEGMYAGLDKAKLKKKAKKKINARQEV